MRTLLLADDNITVQRVIALTFAREPIRVVVASDGRQAMDRISSARPDIVLVATSLPQVSGYDLARYVRSQTGLQHIPVLVLSGAFENVDQAQLAASGANGVIEKPVEPALLISRVNDLLGGTPGVSSAADGAATADNVPGETKTPASALPSEVTSTGPPPPQTREPDRDTDYRDSLDEAFDTLDEQLAGRKPTGEPHPPARPAAAGGPESANPVYEVDDEWFGDGGQARADVRAGRRDDGSSPDLGDGASPVYEVDEEWFAEHEQTRASRVVEQKPPAKEMALDEVSVPERPASPMAPAAEQPPAPVADTGFTAEPVARPLPIALFLGGDTPKPAVDRETSGDQEPLPVPSMPAHAPVTGVLADDFEALLAMEQGENAASPIVMPLAPTAAPAITGAMLEQISAAVADRLRASVRVEAPPPQITGAMLDQVAATVAERLKGSVHVEPVAPPITDDMLAALARRVADGLAPNVRVEPAVPEFTNEMLDRMALSASDRLKDRVKVEAPPPEISGAMLDQVAATVAERLKSSVQVEPPAITNEMLDHIAGRVGERVQAGFTRDQLREAFGDSIRQTVAEMVRQVVSETSERLVREEIERIKAQAQQP